MTIDPDLPRVAYLTSQYPAASHTFILREVAALRELGFDIRTCSIRRTGAEHHIGPEETAAAAGTFHVLDAARSPVRALGAQFAAMRRPGNWLAALRLALTTGRPGAKGLLYQMFYFAEAAVLAQHLRATGVDHLHNHFADPSANVALLAAALAGIPFSYTLHGPAELFEPRSWHLPTKTARARFVVCISHFCRSQAMYFSDPAHWHKLRIVHCGVLSERYDAPERAEGCGAHLVFVGRLTAIKGVRLLLEAFAEARRTRPGLTLTLIGDGDERVELERLAAPLGEAVKFAGYRSQGEVAQTLAGADALVLPSFAEGLPVVLMEALASACPVIATQVAGVSELVEDGVSGFLVPPGDVVTLTDRIGKLADDPDLRRRMGAAGRDRVRAEFDARAEAARIGALFAGRGGDSPRPDPLPKPLDAGNRD